MVLAESVVIVAASVSLAPPAQARQRGQCHQGTAAALLSACSPDWPATSVLR